MIDLDDKAQSERRKASFLVRLWEEESGVEGDQPVLRGYLRDLASGEQRYLSDPSDLAEEILRLFRAVGSKRESADAEEQSDTGFGMRR